MPSGPLFQVTARPGAAPGGDRLADTFPGCRVVEGRRPSDIVRVRGLTVESIRERSERDAPRAAGPGPDPHGTVVATFPKRPRP